MANCRLEEFFEDATGQLSMIRLITFGAFFVSSAALLLSVYSSGSVSEGLMGVYLTAFCLLGANSKYNERVVEVAKVSPSEAIKDMDVKAENVNVS